jgi:hypothetical protein
MNVRVSRLWGLGSGPNGYWPHRHPYRKALTSRCSHRAARFGFGRRFLGRLGIGARVFPATSAAYARRIRDTDHSLPARVRSWRRDRSR